MEKKVEIFVSGRVQGVFFRAFILKKARELGLFGWVGNLKDGRVKIVAQGEKEALEKLIEYAKVGSPLARVSKVNFVWSDDLDKFDDFKVNFSPD
ncbi:MAG: acylphosphatase [Patescibacteria group bacterium]|nr:MAG: acylphosphatase [Patescibacteria group bacterium]